MKMEQKEEFLVRHYIKYNSLNRAISLINKLAKNGLADSDLDEETSDMVELKTLIVEARSIRLTLNELQKELI